MKLLKYQKFKELHIVCKKCNKQIQTSQSPYKGCNHPIERQRYKAIVNVNGGRKTRDLKAMDYNDAIIELAEFKKELSNPFNFGLKTEKVEVTYDRFIDCIMMYSDYLENVDVLFFQKKIRTKEYIRDTISYLIKFKFFLEKNGYKIADLTIFQVDIKIVDRYFEELSQSCKSNSTYNHNIRAMKGFYKFLIDIKKFQIFNPMSHARLIHESPNPINVSDKEFDLIINSITPENSVFQYKNGVKKNMYRHFVKEAFELIAYTGMRITEAISIKYSDIVLDADGELDYVMGIDLKYEKAHNYKQQKAPKIVPIPYSPELEDLLERLDYKNHLGEDVYLIGPDENISRETMAKQLSHSFKFYRDKAGITSPIGLKHLRKSFLTKIETQTGLVESLGYQKTKSVIQNNYLVKPEIARAVKKKGFRLFN